MLGRSGSEQARVTPVKHPGHDQETVRGYGQKGPLTAALARDQLAGRIRWSGRARGSRWGGKLPSGKHCARGTTAVAP